MLDCGCATGRFLALQGSYCGCMQVRFQWGRMIEVGDDFFLRLQQLRAGGDRCTSFSACVPLCKIWPFSCLSGRFSKLRVHLVSILSSAGKKSPGTLCCGMRCVLGWRQHIPLDLPLVHASWHEATPTMQDTSLHCQAFSCSTDTCWIQYPSVTTHQIASQARRRKHPSGNRS